MRSQPRGCGRRRCRSSLLWVCSSSAAREPAARSLSDPKHGSRAQRAAIRRRLASSEYSWRMPTSVQPRFDGWIDAEQCCRVGCAFRAAGSESRRAPARYAPSETGGAPPLRIGVGEQAARAATAAGRGSLRDGSSTAVRPTMDLRIPLLPWLVAAHAVRRAAPSCLAETPTWFDSRVLRGLDRDQPVDLLDEAEEGAVLVVSQHGSPARRDGRRHRIPGLAATSTSSAASTSGGDLRLETVEPAPDQHSAVAGAQARTADVGEAGSTTSSRASDPALFGPRLPAARCHGHRCGNNWPGAAPRALPPSPRNA